MTATPAPRPPENHEEADLAAAAAAQHERGAERAAHDSEAAATEAANHGRHAAHQADIAAQYEQAARRQADTARQAADQALRNLHEIQNIFHRMEQGITAFETITQGIARRIETAAQELTAPRRQTKHRRRR